MISTTGETKFEATDGSLNGTWDGGTLQVPSKEKTDKNNKPCGVEGPRNSAENHRTSVSLNCNRKWTTLFGSKL